MKTSVSKSKQPYVATPQQPKTTQAFVPQPARELSRPKSAPTPAPTPEEIAKRAYEIYLEKGCPQGQDEQNWTQAERELRKGTKVVSA